MDIGWATIYAALSLITLRYAWDTEAKWLAVGLVFECTMTNVMGGLASADSSPAINVMLDIGMMIVASFAIVEAPVLAVMIITLSTLGCVLGLAYSTHADPDMLYQYEERANAIFALKCGAVLFTGLWNVVGNSVRRFFHWRALRRHAADAAHRAWMARHRRP